MKSSTNKVILLAEDDSDDRELFCEALAGSNDGPLIHCTENGKEALKKLEDLSSHPDIIFLDINMPVMNGWQCLKAIKQDDRYKHLPVVIYSSSSNQREEDIAMDLGATCFFTKPNDYYQFKSKLREIVFGNSVK